MSRAMHFEIRASNPQSLIDFHTNLFGWSFSKFPVGEYWTINTGPDSQPGINGGLLPRPGPAPGPMASPNAFVITVEVDNLDASMTKPQMRTCNENPAITRRECNLALEEDHFVAAKNAMSSASHANWDRWEEAVRNGPMRKYKIQGQSAATSSRVQRFL